MARAREVPGEVDRFGRHAFLGERLVERVGDDAHVAVRAHLGDEAPAGSERAGHAGDDVWRRLLHPVQRGVGEDGVGLAFDGEGAPVGVLEGERGVERPRALDHRGIAVDADHVGAAGGDGGGQRARAAAEIDDALAGLRREQIDHVGGEGRDEAERAVVEPGVPGGRPVGAHGVGLGGGPAHALDSLSLTAAGRWPAPPRGRRMRGGPRSRPVARPSKPDAL